nr:MAG TPA: hypothetical protein [Caudoviricetes sp.]
MVRPFIRLSASTDGFFGDRHKLCPELFQIMNLRSNANLHFC